MTYGNYAHEMIESGNKRTFFDLPRKPCNSAIFGILQKRKSFNFFEQEKQKLPYSS